MSNLIGYKQHIDHFNTEPDIKTKICNVSDIVKHIKVLTGTTEYYFDVIVNKDKSITKVRHSYHFNDLNNAKNIHSKTRTKFYDQETKPYLHKINNGKKLTNEDKEKILSIINNF